MTVAKAEPVYLFDFVANNWKSPGRANLQYFSSRQELVRGTYFPTKGVTCGTISQESDLVESSVYDFGSSYDNTVISNKKFSSTVYVSALNIKFSNCLFVGPATFVADKIVICTNSRGRNMVFEDCTLRPRYNDYRQHIIQGHDFTLRRCHLSRGVDGVSGLGNTDTGRLDIVVEDSVIEDLTFFSPDPTHTSDNATHNDGIQVASGKGLTVRGSVIAPYYTLDVGNPTAYPRVGGVGNAWPVSPYSGKYRATSCIMLNYDAAPGPADEVLVEYSWMTGAAVGINSLTTSTIPTFMTIQYNHLGLDWRLIDDKGLSYTVPNSYALCGPQSNVTVQNNYLWVPGDPLNSATPNNTRKLTNA